jgi:uncharacterized SAM-binding protein YcdF (DUF218 family)
MFFLLSKALLFFISPFTWFIAALIAALFVPSPKWKTRMRWATVSIFLIFTNSYILLETTRLWEIEGKKMHQIDHYDVGIVLTGMFEYNNDLETLSARRGTDRIWQALNLYHAHKIKKILITGDHGYVSDRGLHEAQQLKDVLIDWGIPKEDIITEEKSRNTHENAIESQQLLARKFPHFRTFLLITSGRHMRRARACFTHAGMTFDTYSTDLYSSPTGSYYWDQYIVPDSSNFSEWNALLKEMIGYVAYWFADYL